jgi:hypothetical protein
MKSTSFSFFLLCWLLIFLTTPLLNAQTLESGISGVIRDAETNDPLPGVNVLVVGSESGTASDPRGRFRLEFPPGSYTLRFEMLGYQPYLVDEIVLEKGANRTFNIYLIQQALEYGEAIEVVGERELSRQPLGSALDIRSEEIQGRAGALEDVSRTLQTLPGVVSEGDFSGKMYVRGGRVDENLVLLDRIYIYEPYHLNGLVSIFNPDLVKDIEFYAGGFPAKYGQAMSAVIEVYNRYGQRGPLQGNANISMISSGALLEGALPGPRGSFLLSARVNYYDRVMDWLKLPDTYFRPSFYDYQLKFFYPLNKKHLFEVNGLFSGDKLYYTVDQEDEFFDLPKSSEKFERRQALDIASVDWKWVLSDKVFAHTNAAYLFQLFDARYTLPASHRIYFKVHNYDIRSEFTLLPVPHHKIESGFYLHLVGADYTLSFPKVYWDLIYSNNKNSSVRLSDDSTLVSADYRSFYKYGGVFLQDQWEILPGRLITNLGMRLEYLDVTGDFIFNPRASMVYHLAPRTILKAAWGWFSQYSRDPLVFDPDAGNRNTTAPLAVHYIGGVEHRFQRDYLIRAEVYYKDFSDLIATDPQLNYANTGSGYSYGVDLFFQKKISRNWNGWLSYSYGISRRKDRSAAPYYYPLQDQRHTLNVLANYQPRKFWNIGLKWQFNSGKPYTPIEQVIYLPDSTGNIIPLPLEGAVNSSRFPAYSRIDLRLERQLRIWGNPAEIYLEVINLLNRNNVFDYNYNSDYSEVKATYQLPRLPVLGFKLIF